MGNRSYTTGGGSSTEVYEYIRALNQKFGYQFLEKLNGGRVVKISISLSISRSALTRKTNKPILVKHFRTKNILQQPQTCLCQFKGNGKVILGVYPKQEATGGSEPTEEVRVRPVLLELETINKKLTLASHPGVVSNKLIHETKQVAWVLCSYSRMCSGGVRGMFGKDLGREGILLLSSILCVQYVRSISSQFLERFLNI
eukprot:723829-Amorphochlora_amoeboformis.AAC.2